MVIYQGNTDNLLVDAPSLKMVKSGHGTIGTFSTSVADNEILGAVEFYGTDGTDADTLAALMQVEVDDASPEAGGIGAAFVWKTMPGGGTTAAAERLRIAAAGDVTVSTGNVVIGTSGKGIDFSATSDASGSTSELLDDYEEGTWTPAYSGLPGSITYGTQSGTYTKIGRQVHAICYLGVAGQTTGTATITITGLPFASGAFHGASGAFGQVYQIDTTQAGTNGITALINSGASEIVLYEVVDDGNWVALTGTAINGTNTGLRIGITYFA